MALRRDLARTLDLVNIPSESGSEAQVYDYVESGVALAAAFSTTASR